MRSDGIYFIGRSGGELALRFLGFADGTARRILPVEPGYVGLSVSPAFAALPGP